jgi:hypothetical protein
VPASHRYRKSKRRRNEMSYSFNVAASTKAEAKARISAEFDKVVASQPVHAADRDAAEAAAAAFVDVLADPADGEEIRVSVHGSVGWRTEGEFTHSNVGVSAQRARAE